jgi:DNA replication protein DnaC
MIHTQTVDKLHKMKLFGMAEAIQSQLALASSQEMTFTDLFGLVVDSEWMYRDNKRMKRLLKGAQFKEKTACIEALDYRSSRGLKKSIVHELMQNRWIDNNQNILVTGPAGSGKSFFAQALGNHATRHGFSVSYIRMPKLLFALVKARAEGTYLNMLRKLEKTRVLILDDLGLAPIGDQEKQDLMEIIEDRHKAGATIVLSQLPTSAWHAYLGGSLVAEGILDRLMSNHHRFDLKAPESLRKDESLQSVDSFRPV